MPRYQQPSGFCRCIPTGVAYRASSRLFLVSLLNAPHESLASDPLILRPLQERGRILRA